MTPEPPYTFPVPSVLQDNFEATAIGSQWTVVDQEGDATAAISTDTAHTGSCAGKFTVSASSTSRAYIYKALGGLKTDVWASGWFDVTQPGADAGSNVPYIRFFDGPDLQNDRIADVYRYNGGGDAWLRTANGSGGWTYVKLNVLMPLNTWHQVTLHVVPNGSASNVQVWIDAVLVYSNTAYNLHTTTHLTTVLLGAEHFQQQMVEYFDDVCIGAS
jgi:hypothetical protein